MRSRAHILVALLVAFTMAAVAGLTPALAQDKPRSGGELVALVPSEPPSYDGHAEGTFGVVHPLAPHYNGLLRIDPFDKTGTKVVPDVAESWTVSKDGLTYTVKLRRGRQVPRRRRDDVAGRQGLLRQDRVPARGRALVPQGRVPRGGSGGSAGSLHHPLPPEVAAGVLPHHPGLALQLDLQGRHPREGRALVREERDGHRALQVRGAREGLALGREKERRLLGQGQALSRRLPRPLHQRLLRPGGGGSRGAGAHPVPRLQPRRTGRPRRRRSAPGSPCRRAPGTACCWWR